MRMELVEMPVEQKQLCQRQKWPTGSSGQKKEKKNPRRVTY